MLGQAMFTVALPSVVHSVTWHDGENLLCGSTAGIVGVCLAPSQSGAPSDAGSDRDSDASGEYKSGTGAGVVLITEPTTSWAGVAGEVSKVRVVDGGRAFGLARADNVAQALGARVCVFDVEPPG